MLIATPSTLPRGSSGSADAHPGCIIYASVGPTSARSVSTELHSDFSKMSPWKLLHTKMVALRRGRNGTSLNTSIRTAVLSVYGGGSWGGGRSTLERKLAERAHAAPVEHARERARGAAGRVARLPGLAEVGRWHCGWLTGGEGERQARQGL